MIDLHGHYLPGVDDGAGDDEASRAMLRLAAADGIGTVVVTPHACSALCTYRELNALRKAWDKFHECIGREKLGLKTIGGAEVYFTSDLMSVLKDNRDLLTINNGSYFLLEFPADYVYAHSKEFIFKVMTEDLIPVISHAERNQEIQRSPAVLRELVKAGALCQVNAGSFRGDFGSQARNCAYELLRDNLVHVIASDAHDLDRRRPELSFVRPLLTGVEPEKIDLYLDGIPAAIIADQAIPDIGEPVSSHAKRSFFDLFRRRDS